MARKTKSPLSVPQTDDQWYCAVRKLHTWVRVEEEGESYFRPSVLMVVDLKSGMIQAVEIVREPISTEELYKKLEGVMVKPPKESGFQAHRPEEVHFEDEALMQAIQPLLAEAQVTVRYEPQRENMDAIVQELEKGAFGGEDEDIPGLLDQKGVKPELVGGLFSAASAFYRAEPWIHLSNMDILSVQTKSQKAPYFVIVMGQGGEEYGLSIFRDWQEVESFFEAAHPLDAIPREGRHAFLFNEPPYVSIADLDAVETYGWELPAPDLVPTPSLYLPDRIKRPDSAMLRWYEAALRSIPEFVSSYLETKADGTHSPAEADLEVETSSGKTQVHIRYPGGDISDLENRLGTRLAALEQDDENIDPDLLMLDRRGMEGLLAQLSSDIGAVSPIDDPALIKAQQIMYDAWDERSPSKRITLAKKALQTSPNCADAYVLLAQEEAQTPRQALERYQSGVEAGRRALGEDFFADPGNIGFFWGITETRPFMRALEGLATTQWELGQREEAEKVYREMLRLNPGDNQGIRYLLLGLLLEMGKDDQAQKLLNSKDYKGDWSAQWAYSGALLAFKKHGDSPEAKKALKQALEVNQHVPDYLTSKKRIPSQQPSMITMGGEDEAVYYVSMHLNYWRKTPGAIDWLKANEKKSR